MSTLAPFAAVEALINQGVAGTLANAVATFNGGDPFGVVFDRQPADFERLAEASGPQASFDLGKAPGLAYGAVLSIGGENFKVTGGLEPDSSGWVTVQLESA